MSTIYIHWPYCLSKCFYCDFNSIACQTQPDWGVWYEAYCRVLSRFAAEYYDGADITSIYFGGGTPSLMNERLVGELLCYVAKLFKLQDRAEVTLEVNPKTLGRAKAVALRNAGVNRISVGVQSLNDKDLKLLGRIHSSVEATTCVYELSNIFQNISIDMIYNRPGQELGDWVSELAAAAALPVKHMSLYELIVEGGTPLKKMIQDGIVEPPSTAPEFFEKTIEVAEQHGFEIYEVSNYVRKGTEFLGRHNLSYWRYDDFFGIGPGAHSRVSRRGRKFAIGQRADISAWLLWSKDPRFEVEALSDAEEYTERLLMGLRTKFGLKKDTLNRQMRAKCGFEQKLQRLRDAGYACEGAGVFGLTREGMLKLNMIIEYLTADAKCG